MTTSYTHAAVSAAGPQPNTQQGQYPVHETPSAHFIPLHRDFLFCSLKKNKQQTKYNVPINCLQACLFFTFQYSSHTSSLSTRGCFADCFIIIKANSNPQGLISRMIQGIGSPVTLTAITRSGFMLQRGIYELYFPPIPNLTSGCRFSRTTVGKLFSYQEQLLAALAAAGDKMLIGMSGFQRQQSEGILCANSLDPYVYVHDDACHQI